MGVLALQKVWTLIPISIICNIWALFKEVEIKMWRSSKILLSMRIIAFAPLMLFIDVGTKTCFVRINHEFFEAHCLFVLVEVAGELPVCHQISYCGALFGAERQWVYLLLLLI